jgi:hypothetical protein
MVGIVAIIVFIIAAVSYAGLYFYNLSLEKQIAAKLGRVQDVQKVFSDAQEVGNATDFKFRAEIAGQLLDGHVAVSPIFKFLSENTLSSVMYSKFSLKQGSGVVAVDLIGEAPTYAALAYQKEILKKKTTELSDSTLSDMSLTQFGTVTFKLALTFKPGYLSYAKTVNAPLESQGASVVSSVAPTSVLPVGSAQVGATNSSGVVPPPIAPSAPSGLLPAATQSTNPNGQSPTLLSLPPLVSGGTTGSGAPATAQMGTSTTQPNLGSSETSSSPASAPSAPATVVNNTSAGVPTASQAATSSPSFLSSFWSWFKFW